MYLKWGTVGGRGKGNGEQEGGGQYTANLGSEWMGIAPRRKEGFQVSKRGGQEARDRDFQVRGLTRGLGMHLRYHANLVHCVYVVLIKDCV